MGTKKLNKLDDSKKILKKGIGIESEKLWKQDRYQGNKLENGNKSENGNKLKMKLKVY